MARETSGAEEAQIDNGCPGQNLCQGSGWPCRPTATAVGLEDTFSYASGSSLSVTRSDLKSGWLPTPPIPKEHGAWAVLYAPLVMTLVWVGRWDLKMLLFLVAVTALFLAHEPLARLARLGASGSITTTRVAFWFGWLVVYLLVAVAAAAWLLFYYQLWHLLSLGAASVVLLVAHLLLTAARAEKSMLGEFLGICGLTLTAPGTYYVLLDRLDSFAFLLWFINLLYFTSGILYVKMRVARFARKPAAVALTRQCAFYHVLLLVLVITLIWSKQLSLWIFLAFLPAAIRAFRGMGVPQPSLNMRRVGYTEVALTVVFVIMLVWGLNSSPHNA